MQRTSHPHDSRRGSAADSLQRRMETCGDPHFLSIAFDGSRIGRVALGVRERSVRAAIRIKINNEQLPSYVLVAFSRV